jgi:hypothetical protein
MLEVGIMNGQGDLLNFTQAQTHFFAWCIVSSPLTLGMNVTDQANIDAIWPIITNTEALDINSDYAGFSGSIFATNNTKIFYAPCGWGVHSEWGLLSSGGEATTLSPSPLTRCCF